MAGQLCITCLQMRPEDQFCYLATGRRSRECFDCKESRAQRVRDPNTPHSQIVVDGLKACSKCGEVKPVEDFYATRWERTGRLSWCKECFKAGMRAKRLAERIPRNEKARKESREALLRKARDAAKSLANLWPASHNEEDPAHGENG